MLLGILFILLSSLAYNFATVVLAALVRTHLPGIRFISRSWLLSQANSVILIVLMNALGWVFEVLSLRLISLTLARVLSVAGVGFLLIMARWSLREMIGRRDLALVGVLLLGTMLTVIASPPMGNITPSLVQWFLLCILFLSLATLPYLLEIFQLSKKVSLEAIASGSAYAFSGVCNKAIAIYISSKHLLPLALLLIGLIVTSLWGFWEEVRALRYGSASTVSPIILAISNMLPLAAAPILFGETWPADNFKRVLLMLGISMSMVGTLMLSVSSNVSRIGAPTASTKK